MYREAFSKLKNKKVIVAVSGGVDSMVLISLICAYKNELNITPVVAHFEHGIRKNASVLDMELVREYCGKLGVPFVAEQANIPALLEKTSVSTNLEELARRERYGFLFRCKEDNNADFIVVAHHRDDICETMLMNIIRGCGISGLCPMRDNGDIVRPLAEWSKADLYSYAKNNGVPFREDATNKDTEYLRNSVRLELMPYLKSKNPKITESLTALRNIALGENDFFDEYIKALSWINEKPYGYDIKIEDYQKAHKALKGRCIFFVLRAMGITDYNSGLFERINGLFTKETGKKIAVSRDVWAYSLGNAVAFVRQSPKPLEEYLLQEKTTTPFGDFTVTKLNGVSPEQLKSAPPNVAYFSEECLPLTVRSRKDGDRITTFSGNTKKLKDLLIDSKIPVFLRDSVGVVCSGNRIIWVAGVMRSNLCPVKDGTVYEVKGENLFYGN